MSDSKEYKALMKYENDLEIAFNGVERKVVHQLHNGGFINEALHDETLNPKSMQNAHEKAGVLVNHIKKAVKGYPQNFSTLLGILRAAETNLYWSLASNLKRELEQQQVPNSQQGISATYSNKVTTHQYTQFCVYWDKLVCIFHF